MSNFSDSVKRNVLAVVIPVALVLLGGWLASIIFTPFLAFVAGVAAAPSAYILGNVIADSDL